MLSLDTVQGRVVESQGVTLLTELEWQYGTLVDRDQEEVHRPREIELSTNLREVLQYLQLKYNDGKMWTLVCKDHILKVLVSKDP